jgi:hypothetical protein
LEIFQNELEQIITDGGGDEPESLLSASLKVMSSLNWKIGSTKSLVVLTDGGYLAPDRDGVAIADVIRLSKSIDPVNIYVITTHPEAEQFLNITEPTGGKTVTNFDELSLLTDYIMERNDSLPRVEETDEILEKPTLEILESNYSETEVSIKFETNGCKTIVILNDLVLGTTTETEITISEVTENSTVTLVPLRDEIRGENITIRLNNETNVPKAPNTGKR